MAKSKFESHVVPHLEKIERWAKAGATAKDIADKIHVSYSTFRKYLYEGQNGDERYKTLSAAFAQACEVPDEQIETALFDRARGITYFEEIWERVFDESTGTWDMVLVKKVKKFIPPDPTTLMFWLTNRRPDRWKYKPGEADGGKEDERGVIMIPEARQDG